MEKKINNNDAPDIQSMLNDLTGSGDNPIEDFDPKNEAAQNEETERPQSETPGKCRLWEEFKQCLKETMVDADAPSKKFYAIDEDIVATLHQCNFGAKNVYVINSILRTFLIDNIKNLKEMPQTKAISLLDKY